MSEERFAGWKIDPEIESHLAELGEAVLSGALRQAESAGDNERAALTAGESVDVTVTLSLRTGGDAEGGSAARRREVCCVCHRDNGVIICYGPCCPGIPGSGWRT